MIIQMLTAPGRIEPQEVPPLVPGPGEMVVRVRAALTCGTDLKAWRRGHPKMPFPTPFGHEFSGEVAAIGEGVSPFRPGDAVMAVHSAPCEECFYCRAGQENLCDSVMERKVLGAYAEEILLPAHIVSRNVFPKPARLSFEEAAFLEPVACVVHAARVQPLKRGETVLIVGSGPIGLLFLLLARTQGCGQVIIAGRRENRLETARQLGADLVVDADGKDALDRILAATSGRGADQVVECTGRPEVWEATPAMVRKGGRILLYGGCPGGTTATFDTARLHYDEITLQGAFHFTPAAVAEAHGLLASGTLDVSPLLSGRLPLSRLEEALRRLQEGKGIKYALLPEDPA